MVHSEFLSVSSKELVFLLRIRKTKEEYGILFKFTSFFLNISSWLVGNSRLYMLWGVRNILETRFVLSLSEHLERNFGGIQIKISRISCSFPHYTVTEIECCIDLWYGTQKKIPFPLQFITGSERCRRALAHMLKGRQGYLSVIMFSDWSSSIQTHKVA